MLTNFRYVFNAKEKIMEMLVRQIEELENCDDRLFTIYRGLAEIRTHNRNKLQE
jgi:hypothetical protein